MGFGVINGWIKIPVLNFTSHMTSGNLCHLCLPFLHLYNGRLTAHVVILVVEMGH